MIIIEEGLFVGTAFAAFYTITLFFAAPCNQTEFPDHMPALSVIVRKIREHRKVAIVPA